MDWLTFKFCVLIWILCVSKSQSQLRNPTNTSNQLKSACLEGQHIVPPDPCSKCICFSGQVYCTNHSCEEKKCIKGMELPQPDECNKCICRRGKVTCTRMVCIPAPQCNENHVMYPAQDKYNACICKGGFLSCTSNVCAENSLTITTTRTKMKKKEKCVEGSQLHGPDRCLDCICQSGKKRCKNVCNTVVDSQFEGSKCVVGQVIPKPDNCNTCECVNGHIMCTHHPCAIVTRNAVLPGSKGRLKEKNEKAHLEMFDKKISVEPFINMLSPNKYKRSHKLTHSHSYNGFHQEIKVHASHSPKDTTKLLNVLANSLDNAPLASISQKLLTSNPVSSNQDLKKPFDHSVNQTNQLGDGNVLSAQTSTLITSSSQSNETILVFPHTEPSDDKVSLSVLPLESKHGTTWKTVSAPDPLNNNSIQNLSIYSQEENDKDYYDKPPAMITPIDSNPIIHNPTKLGPPGHHNGLLTKLVQDTTDTPSIATQSIYSTLRPKSININDGKMTYAPFSPEKTQFKPAPSSFVVNHDTLPHLRPFQSTKPRTNHIIYYTSPTPILRPELNPDNNVGQQKVLQYQFAPSPSNFYPNQGTPEHFQSKPKEISSLPINYYNKGVPGSPQHLNNPNPPIVSANQYKSTQLGLKPTPGSSYPDNIHLNPAPTNLPYQKNRISAINNEALQFEPNSKAHLSDILNSSQNVVKPSHKQPNSPQSQSITNPFIYYNNEYEAPKIIVKNPEQDQLTPNYIIFNKHTEDHDPLHTPPKSGFEKLPHKDRNKTKTHNTTHSHYDKHASVTYNSEYNLNDPDEISQEFDLTKKVDHYLNIPYLQLNPYSIQSYLTLPGQQQNYTLPPTMIEMNKNGQHDPWNITNKQFEEDSLSPNKSILKGTYSVSPNIFAKYLHKSSKTESDSPQDNSVNESSGDPTQPKSILPLENQQKKDDKPLAMITPIDSNPINHNPVKLSPPGQHNGLLTKPARDTEDTSSIAIQSIYSTLYPEPNNINNGKMIYAPFSPENTQFKPAPLSFVANHDELAHLRPFQSTKLRPNNIINHTTPTPVLKPELNPDNNVGQQKLSQYQFASNPSNFYLNEGTPEQFQSKLINYYNNKGVPVPTAPVPKSNDHLPRPSQTVPPENQHIPGVFNDQGSNNEFQYFQPLQKLSRPKLETSQNHQLPGMLDEHRPAANVQNPFNLTEDLTHPKVKLYKSSHFDPYKSTLNAEKPKDNQHIPVYSQFGPTQNQHKQEDNYGVEDGFQYAHNAYEDHREKPFHKLPPGPIPNKQTPGMLDERISHDGFRHPSYLAKNPINSRGNLHNRPLNQFRPDKKRLLGVFTNHGFAHGFHYPSKSADISVLPKNKQSELFIKYEPTEKPHKPWRIDDPECAGSLQNPPSSTEFFSFSKDNSDATPESNFKQSPNQLKTSSLDQISQYIFKINNYSSNNPVRPWMYLYHEQYKPTSFDNLPNGVHNIPWSLPEDYDKVVNTVSFTHPPRFEPDDDQYKSSSFDNLFNGIQDMSKPVPNQDNNALGSNDELTTPQSVFKPVQDQNENVDLFDDRVQIEINNSMDLINSDSMQNNIDHRIKPENVPDSLLLTDGGKFPGYYDKLFPLFISLMKPTDRSHNNSEFSTMDGLQLFFVSAIAEILDYIPSKDQVNKILNWLTKLISRKDNTSETKHEIDLTKIFSWLSKLTSNRINISTENIPFNGFDPEIADRTMNDFKEDTQTVTPTPSIIETKHDIDNRFHSVSTAIEKTQQQDAKEYPEVHIILNQPDNGGDVDLPYIEADGEAGPAPDMRSKEVYSTLFPIMFHSRFRYRPQDQKDECGDGTQWISNCHTCSCYFGQTMCLRIQDCKLRPFGEPMICKPYSQFKMGCYTCECNGDGVAECDATDCGKEPKEKRQDSHELALPIYHEFFENKKTDAILQYYKFLKELPKDCPRQNSETQYPTCEHGTSWITSCHKCECNKRGKHECTKINDCVLDFDAYGKPGRCKPNSKFYPRTNRMPCVECWCNDEGILNCPEADLKKP